MRDNSPVSGRELARLWSEATMLGTHSTGCGCGGGHAVHIDPAMVESDILDYLADKYGQGALADCLAARQDKREGAFAIWLAGLDESQLGPDDLAQLKHDLAVTLGSLSRGT